MKAIFLTFLLLFTQSVLGRDPPSHLGHTLDITEVKFNPETTQLISYSAADGWLCLWDIVSGRLVWQTKTEFIQKAKEYYNLSSFVFSPDQTLIASGSANGTIQLWDAKTGRLLWRADAHKANVTAVIFSPDGKDIISAAWPEDNEDEINVLRIENQQIVRTLRGKFCSLVALKFDESGNLLRAGNLDGNVLEWDWQTGKRNNETTTPPCRNPCTYPDELSFSANLNFSAMRTGPKALTLRNTRTGNTIKRLKVEDFKLYPKLSADGRKLLVNGLGEITFYDLVTGKTRKFEDVVGTGSALDLNQDGRLFADGESLGNASIKITDTKTGKSRLIDGGLSVNTIPLFQPSDLEIRLGNERMQRQALIIAAQARRDKQAAIDTVVLERLVHITFEHYGDMKNPLDQRMVESDTPNKSRVVKAARNSNAIWLRLHNDSPLPIKIPTQSMYLPNQECFYELSTGKRIFGLCDNSEISIWHGLENKEGEQIPYGIDFGSSAILLPNKSVLFPVPIGAIKNGYSIRFSYTFQKETDDNELKEYGKEVILRYGESNLPKVE